MRFSSLTDRIAAEGGTDADGSIANPWEVHDRAMARVRAGDHVTVLSIGQEADRRTPPVVVDAAVDALRDGHHHYADVRGQQGLRDAVARYHGRLTRQAVEGDSVTVFAGAQNALFASAQTLLETGDEVVLIAPWYTTYPATFGSSGATVVPLITSAADDHRVDADALERLLTPRTRVIVLNVPGNPVSHCPDARTVATIVELCVARGIWLVFDGVYLDVVDAADVNLPHGLSGAADVLVTVGSVSKSHRMSGWRTGWTIAPPALSAHFANLALCMNYGLPPFVQEAAAVALEQAADMPRTVAAALDARRGLALEALGDIAHARIIDAGRGMFLLIDVAPLGIDARTFALYLLERHAVSVLPCGGFGPGGRTLVRIGLCVDGERLVHACTAIRRCIDALAAGR